MLCISSSLPCHTPLLSFNPMILFFRLLWEAIVWKNLVFLSPLWYQMDFALCFHIADSCSRSSLISFRRVWMLMASLWRELRFSRHCRRDSFSLICLLRSPKMFLLHHCNWCWKFVIFPWVELLPLEGFTHDQANSTTSWHLSSLAHIDSNLNWTFSRCFR